MEKFVADLYKSKGNFGKVHRESRRAEQLTVRSKGRASLVQKFRQVPDNMSPFQAGSSTEVPTEVPTQVPKQKSRSRLSLLKQWKKEREETKRLAKKLEKPVFKAGGKVNHNNSLDTVFTHIKGVPIKQLLKKTQENPSTSQQNSRYTKPETQTSKSQQSIKTNHNVASGSKHLKSKDSAPLQDKDSKKPIRERHMNVPPKSENNKDSNLGKKKQPPPSTKQTGALCNSILDVPKTHWTLVLNENYQQKTTSARSRKSRNSVPSSKFRTSLSGSSESIIVQNEAVEPIPTGDSHRTRRSVRLKSEQEKVTEKSVDKREISQHLKSLEKKRKGRKIMPIEEGAGTSSTNDNPKQKTPTEPFLDEKELQVSKKNRTSKIFSQIDEAKDSSEAVGNFKQKTPAKPMLLSDEDKKTESFQSSERKRASRRHVQMNEGIDLSVTNTPNKHEMLGESSTEQQGSPIKTEVKLSGKKRISRKFFKFNERRNSSENSFNKQETPAKLTPDNERSFNKGKIIEPLKLSENRRKSRKNLSSMEDYNNQKKPSPLVLENKLHDNVVVHPLNLSLRRRTSRKLLQLGEGFDLSSAEGYQKHATPAKSDKKGSRNSVAMGNKQTSSGDDNISYKSLNESLADDVFLTPEKISPEEESVEVNYISPFVTCSRGKKEAREEFQRRKSQLGFDASISDSDPRSPRAAANYFNKILNEQITRIREMCAVWQNYKETENIAEDGCDLIDMTIGQSNLLINKKFEQFRGLIEKCRRKDSLDLVTNEDLHGFWDMMYKQVDDLDKRFDNLEEMKKNNWLESVPRRKTPKKAKVSKRKVKSKSTSSLREAILAARRKNIRETLSAGTEVEILFLAKNKTPKKNAQDDVLSRNSTPGRGILKSSNSKSEKRKTVAFSNNLSSGKGKENNSSFCNIRRGTPVVLRKSQRLSALKLEFD